MSADALPSPFPDVVARWRTALDNLSTATSPCRNLSPAKWSAIRESALAFCNEYGAEAHRLGWIAVHPQHGTARLDACGVLMIGGEPARGVEVDRVIYERTSCYRTTPGVQFGVPIWEFARGGAR